MVNIYWTHTFTERLKYREKIYRKKPIPMESERGKTKSKDQTPTKCANADKQSLERAREKGRK